MTTDHLLPSKLKTMQRKKDVRGKSLYAYFMNMQMKLDGHE